jgi:hypothetical protein
MGKETAMRRNVTTVWIGVCLIAAASLAGSAQAAEKPNPDDPAARAWYTKRIEEIHNCAALFYESVYRSEPRATGSGPRHVPRLDED